jgi:hypothetical protein
MEILAKAFARLKAYPYRERLPGFGVLAVIFLAVMRSANVHVTTTEKLVFGALAVSSFFKIGSRPYWFVMGFVIGGLASEGVPRLLSFFGR